MKNPRAARQENPSTHAARHILIVDDHPIMRLGLAQLISTEKDLEVCGQAGNVEEAVAMIANGQPDLLITDLALPDKHGLEFVKDLQVSHPHCAILVLSMHDESLYAERALRAGARGYLMKKSAPDHLIKAVRQILKGGIYLSEAMAGCMLEIFRRQGTGGAPLIQSLTDRELEVFQLIGAGKSSREIAGQLHLSMRTVDAHRAHMKEKLQLTSGTELVRHAVSWVEGLGRE
ncbi:MAG: response regulator transcription factor [Verrucomicrobiaceae bacterium]|nr:MAG: response regulator transcription factor [Verrucomicrobiaceae bacterium]